MSFTNLEKLLYLETQEPAAGSTVVDQPTGGPIAIHDSITAQALRWYANSSTQPKPDYQRKKTLIYHDPFWSFYSEGYKRFILLMFHEKIKKGFNIYAFSDDTLILLNGKYGLSRAHSSDTSFKCVDDTALHGLLDRMGLDINEVSLLDYVDVRVLILEVDLYRLPDVVELNAFDDQYRQQSIERLVQDPRIRGIACESKDLDFIATQPSLAALPILSLKTSNAHDLNGMLRERITQVEVLKIYKTRYSEAELFRFIEDLSQLRLLRISGCENLGDLTECCSVHCWPKLERLSVSGSEAFSGSAFVSLLLRASNLVSVHLVGCNNLGSASDLASKIRNSSYCIGHYVHYTYLEKLTDVKIEWCQFSGLALLALVRCAPNINSIDLLECGGLADLTVASIRDISESAQVEKLKSLIMYNCDISSAVFFEFMQLALNLLEVVLDANGLIDLTAETILRLPAHIQWGKLKKLSYPHYSDLALLALMERSASLKVIGLSPCRTLKDLTPGTISRLRRNIVWPHLEEVRDNAGVSALALLEIFERALFLRRLACSFYEPRQNIITAQQIKCLPDVALRQLKFLNIYEGLLSPEVLALIQRKSPSVEINQCKKYVPSATTTAVAGSAAMMLFKGAAAGGSVGPLANIVFADTNPEILTVTGRKQLFPLGDAPDVENNQCRQQIVYPDEFDVKGEDIVIRALAIPRSATRFSPLMFDSLEEMSASVQLDPGYDYYDLPFVGLYSGSQSLITKSVNNTIVAMLRPSVACQFYYDEKTDQFYVQTTAACTLRYVLAVPKHQATEADLPEATQVIFTRYKNFQKGDLTLPHRTAREKLDAMDQSAVGSCEQRSVTCLLKNTIKARFARSAVGAHDYLEVYADLPDRPEKERWIRIDLGGYAFIDKMRSTPPKQRLPWPPVRLESASQSPAASTGGVAIDAGAIAVTENPVVLAEETPGQWFDTINASPEVKQSWTFKTNQNTHLAATYLVKTYQEAGENVFFVNHPDQLRCLIDTLILQGKHQGRVIKSPSGAFYQFLMISGKRRLVIDWNAFPSAEVAKYLALLDGNFEGGDVYETLNFPAGLRVVSLQNTACETAYRSADFTTRHDPAVPCSVSGAKFKEVLYPDLFVISTEAGIQDPGEPSKIPEFTIDLYNSKTQWEHYLFGPWSLRSTGFHFDPTGFFTALRAGQACRLKIMNPPLDSPSFNRMRVLLEQQRYFSYLGLSFSNVHVDIEFIETPPRLWQVRVGQMSVAPESHAEQPWVLNTATLSSFLGCEAVELSDGKTMVLSKPGVLEQHRGQLLDITVSHNLQVCDWARLLDAAQAHSVFFNVTLACGVSLPENIMALLPRQAFSGSHVQAGHPSRGASQDRESQVEVIQTSDIEESILYGHEAPETRQHITGCLPSEVFYHLDAKKFDEENGVFSDCHLEQGSILKALLTGKRVILTGSLTRDMQEFFAPILTTKKPYLFFNNQRHGITGELLLVTDTPLPFCPFVKTRSLASSHQSVVNPLLLRSQYHQVPRVPTVAQLRQAKQVSDKLYQNRSGQVSAGFAKKTFVLLVGPTASGKTTFMQEFKRKEEAKGCRFFWGVRALKEFLTAGDSNSVLCLDEWGLLDPKFRAKFKDLSQNLPCIWLDRKRYVVKGKIIAATNPEDYGHRHGAHDLPPAEVIAVDPLPLEVIYENSLKPALVKTGLPAKIQEKIAQQWLALYAHCLAYNAQTVVISPRELELIALSFAAAYTKAESKPEPRLLSKQIAYNVAMTLVPSERLNVEEFQPARLGLLPLPADVQLDGQPFVFLEEHRQVWTLFNYLLSAQEFNKAHQLGLPGINHLSLIGDSNIGKSAFLRAACTALATPFKYLPASALLQKQKDILREVAIAGGMLIHDEGNMVSQLEEDRNAYLMNVDLEGNRLRRDPAAPPFVYCSTGNPPEKFLGREKKTLAEERRALSLSMSSVLRPESIDQLKQKLLPTQREQPRMKALLQSAEAHLQQVKTLSLEEVKRFYLSRRHSAFSSALSFGHAGKIRDAKTLAEIRSLLREGYDEEGTNPSSHTVRRFNLH